MACVSYPVQAGGGAAAPAWFTRSTRPPRESCIGFAAATGISRLSARFLSGLKTPV
jgi:hypothetical protein